MKHALRILAVLLLGGVAILVWLGWPDTARLPVAAVQGRQPNISDPREQLIPTVGVAKVVGWRGAAAPTPAAGLTVKPFATGLDHPRWLYRLPNGDVLVAESNSPPRKAAGCRGSSWGC